MTESGFHFFHTKHFNNDASLPWFNGHRPDVIIVGFNRFDGHGVQLNALQCRQEVLNLSTLLANLFPQLERDTRFRSVLKMNGSQQVSFFSVFTFCHLCWRLGSRVR